MSANQINISHIGQEVSTQRTHDACLITHLSPEGEFTTSELRDINWCRMFKGILFISNITNNLGTHIQQSATDKVTNFNLIHDLNWYSKNHTTTSEWSTWRKAIRILCNESK